MKSKHLAMSCGRGLNWHVTIYDNDDAPTFRLQHCPDCESKLTLDPKDDKGFSYFSIEFASQEDWDDFVKSVLTADALYSREPQFNS